MVFFSYTHPVLTRFSIAGHWDFFWFNSITFSFFFFLFFFFWERGKVVHLLSFQPNFCWGKKKNNFVLGIASVFFFFKNLHRTQPKSRLNSFKAVGDGNPLFVFFVSNSLLNVCDKLSNKPEIQFFGFLGFLIFFFPHTPPTTGNSEPSYRDRDQLHVETALTWTKKDLPYIISYSNFLVLRKARIKYL